MWSGGLTLITDPASIEAAWLAFHTDKAVDAARDAFAGRIVWADRSGLARVKEGPVADYGKPESCGRNYKHHCGEGNLAFHGVGLQSVLMTSPFPPSYRNSLS
jgi:hypothetical protein